MTKLFFTLRDSKNRMSVVETTGFVAEGNDIVFIVPNGRNLRMTSVTKEEYDYILLQTMRECGGQITISRPLMFEDEKEFMPTTPSVCGHSPVYAVADGGQYYELSPHEVFKDNNGYKSSSSEYVRCSDDNPITLRSLFK